MSDVRDGYFYTDENEWVKIEGNKAKFGITDFSQGEMGDLVHIDLPSVSTEVSMGSEIGAMESVKSVESVYAPVSGKIVEVNDKVIADPKISNASPYDDGWFAVIEMSDVSEKEKLLDAAKYRAKVE